MEIDLNDQDLEKALHDSSWSESANANEVVIEDKALQELADIDIQDEGENKSEQKSALAEPK